MAWTYSSKLNIYLFYTGNVFLIHKYGVQIALNATKYNILDKYDLQIEFLNVTILTCILTYKTKFN